MYISLFLRWLNFFFEENKLKNKETHAVSNFSVLYYLWLFIYNSFDVKNTKGIQNMLYIYNIIFLRSFVCYKLHCWLLIKVCTVKENKKQIGNLHFHCTFQFSAFSLVLAIFSTLFRLLSKILYFFRYII